MGWHRAQGLMTEIADMTMQQHTIAYRAAIMLARGMANLGWRDGEGITANAITCSEWQHTLGPLAEMRARTLQQLARD